jgi:hypothetical protein
MDAYAATQQAAVTSLQGVVNWVLDDDWRLRGRWLRCVPIFFCLVDFERQRQFKPPLPPSDL